MINNNQSPVLVLPRILSVSDQITELKEETAMYSFIATIYM